VLTSPETFTRSETYTRPTASADAERPDDPETTQEIVVAPQAVADSCSDACWTVEGRAWELPADVAELLAPAVVVRALPRHPGDEGPLVQCAPRFVAPAPPRRDRPRRPRRRIF
jgi:hypothetical protein